MDRAAIQHPNTIEYKIDEESGSIDFNTGLSLNYKLENKQLSVTVVLENPCHCSYHEEHFVLQLNEGKNICWGHGVHTQIYAKIVDENKRWAVNLIPKILQKTKRISFAFSYIFCLFIYLFLYLHTNLRLWPIIKQQKKKLKLS